MSDAADTPKGITRRQAVGAALGGAGASSLPAFLEPGAALSATEAERAQALAEFFGREELPVPPRSAEVHTSACQYCNVGCGYKIYTWPANRTSRRLAEPDGALGDWISPTFVTRARVSGRDSFVAVVPDRDCIVNKGDHSPRGGTNALTVYTTRRHPLANSTERHLYPQVRDTRGGPLRRVPFDEALDRVADAIKAALDARGPSSIGLWAADHLSPEMNFATTKLFFAPGPKGLYDPALGSDAGVAVRAIHNRPKWNSEHPSIADVVLPAANWGEYSYTRENLERRLRVNERFYDPPGEAIAEYLIFTRLGKRLADRHRLLDPAGRMAVRVLGGRLQRDAGDVRGQGARPRQAQPRRPAGARHQRHPAADHAARQQADRHAAHLSREVRHRRRARPLRRQGPGVDRGRPARVLAGARQAQRPVPILRHDGPLPDHLAVGLHVSLPDRPRRAQPPVHGVRRHPDDAAAAGLTDGDWAELSNQFSRCEGVVNVSDEVQRGLISAIFGWQGPSDDNPFGMPQYYANVKGPGFQSRTATRLTYSRRFSRAGSFRIICTIHSTTQKMTVRVR